jgi:hypothetical protein
MRQGLRKNLIYDNFLRILPLGKSHENQTNRINMGF